MGMTIEEAIKYYENKNVVLTEEEALANTLALNTMRKYQQLQADYENRLKADMVAILEEIQAQIDDLWEATWHSDYRGGFKDGCLESNNIIQQEINSLKENEDGNR